MMRIRRLRIALPARLRPTAERDARLIAEAAARQLAAGPRDGLPRRIAVAGAGATGHALAQRVEVALRGGGALTKIGGD